MGKQIHPDIKPHNALTFQELVPDNPTKQDEQIAELQNRLTKEKDARREDRFVFIVIGMILLDVTFFSVMPSFGGPIGIVLLELLILIPLARRMGMEELAQILNSVIHRIAGKAE